MNSILKLLVSFIPILVMTLMSCSIAPFSIPTTARSLKQGDFEINADIVPPSVGVSYGLTERMDIGVDMEGQYFCLVGSVWSKVSLINQEAGFSLAGFGGGFFNMGDDIRDSRGYYLGPIFSYRFEKIELFSVIKYNQVYWGDWIKDDDGNFWTEIDLEDKEFDYFQGNFGFKILFNEVFSMRFELVGFAELDDFEDLGILGNIGFGWRF